MKTSDLRAKDAAGLEKEVSELLKAHFGLRMQKATQQLTNHSQLGNTRRDIARAKTIQAEQKRAAAGGTSAAAAKKTGVKK
jgi:large subunit ribosomal protein L29